MRRLGWYNVWSRSVKISESVGNAQSRSVMCTDLMFVGETPTLHPSLPSENVDAI